MEELNRIISDPKSANPKDKNRTKKEKSLNLDKPVDPKLEAAKIKAEQLKLRKQQLDAISRTKKIDRQNMNEQSLDPLDSKPVTLPREKNFVSEIKKLEEPISKAPVACQSILKVYLKKK